MRNFFSIVLVSTSLFAQNVVWNSVEFPPSLITKGDLKDKGFSDKSRTLIIQNISQYKHDVKYVNSARAINNLKTKKNYCFVGLNKNEKREEFIYFSKPFMYSLPNEVVILQENLHKYNEFIDENGLINLDQLLQNQSFQLAYTKDRSYSKEIDKTINKYKKNKNIVYRPASDLTTGFLKMLEAKRADYIIEYPVMVSYNSNKDFFSIPIKGSDDTFPVYVGCSKSEIGKNLINEINKVIENNHAELSSYYAQYLDVKTRERYLNDIQK